MNIIDEQVFKNFIKDRNLSENTIESYIMTLNKYTKFCQKTLTQLLDEADEEEENRIRLKRRKITKNMKEFRNSLIEKKYSKSSIRTYMSNIKSFYSHHEIEIPNLPKVQIKEEYHESYEDIPKKEHIKEALEATANLQYKALILFMSSSGTARNEAINLKIQDFIYATKEYHNKKNIEEVIKELEEKNDIVPLWKIKRIKTDHLYYTCCSPEATKAMIKHLKKREKLNNDDKIFNIIPKSIDEFFRRINKKLGWKKKGNGIYFFHSHALRKFNATMIEDVGFANAIQGRLADSITEAYFKHNPKRIKDKYMEHLPKLTIEETEVNIIDDEGKKEIKQLKIEKEDLESRITAMENILYNRDVK